ncbi:AraC family transcriptional regulator [Chryseobacterium piperi]|uniref:AraC family transcriptional regulator n=1 Tax=Chryseobacterium piperi TaxID=558152 RepID=A0A086AGM9_9FLAO|nr:AraC family transcriptional regulator [Chryseobacterium piperi]ASW73909.1 AraC family transcriptional regulator [Chryseobacterium piperi]KFF15843.1 AraC family transcriptional regulator [Chryseobacterium piperi]
MNNNTDHKAFSTITYACYSSRMRDGEQFIPQHVFSYQIAGKLIYNNGENEYVFDEGSFRLTRRNTLIKFNKIPPENGEYQNISVFIDQAMLKSLSMEYDYKATKNHSSEPAFHIPSNELLSAYLESLKPYDQLDKPGNEMLKNLKLKELVVLLLETHPFLKDILFDFTEPGKIDLESFMNRNFRFNVSLERFAYLTGRSLSTFQRDFEKTFASKPRKWLQQKRLQEAYYLIKEKGVSASDVYLEVGFQNLSHFSFAFKKMFGLPPSQVLS